VGKDAKTVEDTETSDLYTVHNLSGNQSCESLSQTFLVNISDFSVFKILEYLYRCYQFSIPNVKFDLLQNSNL
jgi:hypothetical protein